MKTRLKRLHRETEWGFALLSPVVRFREWIRRQGYLSDRAKISRDFQQVFGRPLDWAAPRTLNEKLNWMKRYYRNPLQKIAVDKLAVRDHVAARVGEEFLIPLYAVFERARDIRLDALADAFVLKVNHGSGQNWIVRDKSKVDAAALCRQFRTWMAVGQYAATREWPYQGMPPRILAEALLLDDVGRLPMDYKFHCFAGRVETIQVDMDREEAHRRNFYSPDWCLQPFVWSEWEAGAPLWPNGAEVPPPAALPEMIRLAETLSADFPYARIDLYALRNRIYFGEITFYHGSGFEHFSPPEWDLAFGERLALPSAATP
ncbi:MAG: hypothetical protein LBN38_07245 [Verrucomicrobiota bacterium]|jgi:hypothetical protein|nr:hypothetical protein [Verrucomicrobiota bacterium]